MMVKSTVILNLSSVILLSTGIHSILMIYSNGTREIDLVICAWFHGILTLAFLIWILQRKNQTYEKSIDKGSLKLRLMWDETSDDYNDWKENLCEEHEKKMLGKLRENVNLYVR